MMKILHVVGARPNFMKIAPILAAMRGRSEFQNRLVHTGQHYDEQMSRTFFDELGIPKPDLNLEVGSGTHAEQTAAIMARFGTVLREHRPDLVLVVGDVNSTLACSVASAHLDIPVAHVEAGLRSFDRTMPEEINRVVTDAVSEVLFTTCEEADANLQREGVPEEKIFFVGNVMIDTLVRHLEAARRSPILERLSLRERGYTLVTLHRPSNVDEAPVLRELFTVFGELGKTAPVIFPVHPRTRQRFADFGFNGVISSLPHLILTEPLGYLDFLRLMANARLVLTDSGGIQEETTFLGVPCLTLRENTERPVTITHGTNQLVGTRAQGIIAGAEQVLANGAARPPQSPPLWDGHAAERIVEVLAR